VKDEVLIPESFMKMSSSSLDFHKSGVLNPPGESLTGALKPTWPPIVIEIRIQHESFAEKFKGIRLITAQSRICKGLESRGYGRNQRKENR
jgi:hypothetical protein